jgi:hypothetical protein
MRGYLEEFMARPACVFQKPDVLRAVLGCLPFEDLQVCVCVSVCVRACVHVYVRVHACVCVCVWAHVCACVSQIDSLLSCLLGEPFLAFCWLLYVRVQRTLQLCRMQLFGKCRCMYVCFCVPRHSV